MYRMSTGETAAAVIHDVESNIITFYAALAVLVVCSYDIFLTFDEEVKLIWCGCQSRRLRTVIFATSRYFVLPLLIPHVMHAFSSETACKAAGYTSYIFSGLSRLAISTALTARACVLVGRHRYVAGVLGALIGLSMAGYIGQIVVNTCEPILMQLTVLIAFQALEILTRVLFDIIATAIILFKTLGVIKLQDRSSSSVFKGAHRLIFEHGAVYFIIITTVDIAGAVITLLNPASFAQFILQQLPLPLASISICRFILDLRRMQANFNGPSLPTLPDISFARSSTSKQQTLTRQFGDPIFNPEHFPEAMSGDRDDTEDTPTEDILLNRSGVRDAVTAQRFLEQTGTIVIGGENSG